MFFKLNFQVFYGFGRPQLVQWIPTQTSRPSTIKRKQSTKFQLKCWVKLRSKTMRRWQRISQKLSETVDACDFPTIRRCLIMDTRDTTVRRSSTSCASFSIRRWTTKSRESPKSSSLTFKLFSSLFISHHDLPSTIKCQNFHHSSFACIFLVPSVSVSDDVGERSDESESSQAQRWVIQDLITQSSLQENRQSVVLLKLLLLHLELAKIFSSFLLHAGLCSWFERIHAESSTQNIENSRRRHFDWC